MKRQAARFQIWAYDETSPNGRPLKLGDKVEGGGNAGVLVDIQWRVYLANKKSSWYDFLQLQGEHGYDPNHPRRNASISDPNARQQLIIDPGPRTVNHTTTRTAQCNRDNDAYATTFPPELKPNSIDTLGDILTDDTGRLLVLGGHGNSGSFLFDDFGQPRIDDYANNDGWFDDTSDGTVMARLAMFSSLVGQIRYIDVEYPAWVVCCYPAYVPEILDVVTMDDVIEDMAIRKFAERTDLYGISGTFNDPQHIAPTDQGALIHWRAGRLRWNPDYKPWFYRDIWTILYRPDQYNYLCDALGQSNYPHNQSTRGTFDYEKLGCPPVIDRRAVEACEEKCIRDHQSGDLFVEELAAELVSLETSFPGAAAGAAITDGVCSRRARRQIAENGGELCAQSHRKQRTNGRGLPGQVASSADALRKKNSSMKSTRSSAPIQIIPRTLPICFQSACTSICRSICQANCFVTAVAGASRQQPMTPTARCADFCLTCCALPAKRTSS